MSNSTPVFGLSALICAHRLGVQPGAAVGQVVAGHAGDRRVAQAHRLHALGDPSRLVAVQLGGLAGVDLAEVAATGALLAADQEGGLAVFPALVDVGAAGLLADRVQTLALTSAFSSVYSGPIFARVLIHGGLRSIGVCGVADLEAQQLAAFRGRRSRIDATRRCARHDRQPRRRARRTTASATVGGRRRPDPRPSSARQRRHAGVGDAARHDRRERVEIAVTVQREPVQRGRPRHPDADRGDLAGRPAVAAGHPHAGPARRPGRSRSPSSAHTSISDSSRRRT